MFLPLLAVLELLGLKISFFPICVGETGVATNVGLPQLALDLVSGEEAPLGMVGFLSVPIMFPVVRKNAHSRARRIHDVRQRERRLARAQALLHDLHFDGDEWGNGSDDSLDGLVDN